MRIPRLKDVRERKLLTQVQLAERSGVAEVTINRIERGHREPMLSTVRKLADALGVDPSDLMESEEPAKAAG